MNRKQLSHRRMIAAAFALCAPLAFADDNSMSVLTGDSYAYFNQLDFHAGGFNTPRAPDDRRQAAAPMPQETREAAPPPILLAGHGRATLPSPFSDDKGA